jgi:hypothetical protein
MTQTTLATLIACISFALLADTSLNPLYRGSAGLLSNGGGLEIIPAMLGLFYSLCSAVREYE